ncbi:MAG: FxsA family protein [Alphaproteobacteria bacterium]|nr:FxsA family protein [Alphaproteobacteria bacterium]
MGLLLLIAFIATPIIEIAIFIEAGERFGLWPTLSAVVLTAIIGTALLRWQGLTTWARATQSLQRGHFPMTEVFTGLCLVAAGALLLTPGFLTDAIGFALFVPPIRSLLARLMQHAMQRGKGPKVWVNGQPMDTRSDVIDGEFTAAEPPAAPPGTLGPTSDEPNDDSPWRKDS